MNKYDYSFQKQTNNNKKQQQIFWKSRTTGTKQCQERMFWSCPFEDFFLSIFYFVCFEFELLFKAIM